MACSGRLETDVLFKVWSVLLFDSRPTSRPQIPQSAQMHAEPSISGTHITCRQGRPQLTRCSIHPRLSHQLPHLFELVRRNSTCVLMRFSLLLRDRVAPLPSLCCGTELEGRIKNTLWFKDALCQRSSGRGVEVHRQFCRMGVGWAIVVVYEKWGDLLFETYEPSTGTSLTLKVNCIR